VTRTSDADVSVARGTRRKSAAGKILWGAGLLIAGAGLAVLYFRQSLLAPFNSDGAAIALQASAMLHGNPLLRGWWAADVSFYTTELPEYMAVEAVRGLSPVVVHLSGALTYSLIVLLAALVARGRHTGRAGLARAVLAGGILLAPGIVLGTPVFLENPDHAGTAVPILLLFLILDRWPERWFTAAAACLLLAWTQVADQLALVAAAIPLAVVAAVRLGLRWLRGRKARARGGQTGDGQTGDGQTGDGRAGQLRYDAFLLAAAVVSMPLARGAAAVLRDLGGFYLRPLPQQLLATASQVPGNVRVLGQALLVLFGANVPGGRNPYLGALAYFHVIGLALALAGFAVAAATFFARRRDRVTQVVVVAVLATIAAAIFGTELPDLSHTHEIAVLAPFGAVLAGRVLPGLMPLRWRGAGRALAAALGVWAMCALAALCWAATWSPLTQGDDQALATWLVRHGLTEGLAGYWQADSTTVLSGGKVLVAPIKDSARAVSPWESSADWYDPATHRATFIIAAPAQGGLSVGTERALFGDPAGEYHVGQYVVMVYPYNLLTRLSGRSFPGPASELANG